MTGIERLRKLADATLGYVRVASVTPHDYEYENDVEWDERMRLSELLASIYSQISREQDAMVADSPYDAITPEDRDAIAWVRDHGGLDSVRELLDWVVGHCSTRQQLDFDFWLSGRVMYELGFEEDMADRDEVDRRLLARLMPDGMEWPRFEDGKPVRIGDSASFGTDDVMEVVGVEINRFGYVLHGSINDGMRECVDGDEHGVAVKRPAPKVLDADGVEIRAKETVFDKNTGEELIVTGFEDGRVWCEHRMTDADALPVRGMWSPDLLTHERPENKCRDCAHWQKDPTANNVGVCWFYYQEYEGQDCYAARRGDIGACEEFMPRAKALAGVE